MFVSVLVNFLSGEVMFVSLLMYLSLGEMILTPA